MVSLSAEQPLDNHLGRAWDILFLYRCHVREIVCTYALIGGVFRRVENRPWACAYMESVLPVAEHASFCVLLHLFPYFRTRVWNEYAPGSRYAEPLRKFHRALVSLVS